MSASASLGDANHSGDLESPLDRQENRLGDTTSLLHDLQHDLDLANKQLGGRADGLTSDESDAANENDWISRVTRVQADLEQSKATARSIVQQAESHNALERAVSDASQKVSLLEKELAFNTSLEAELEDIQSLYRRLNKCRGLVIADEVVAATAALAEVRQQLKGVRTLYSSNAVRALESRATNVSDDIVNSVQRYLLGCLKVTTDPPIFNTSARHSKIGDLGFRESVEILQQLDGLEHPVKSTTQALVAAFFDLWSSGDRATERLEVTIDKAFMTKATEAVSAVNVLQDISTMVKFLADCSHPIICQQMSKLIMPRFLEQLETHKLNPHVPVEVDQLKEFEHLLSAVKELSAALNESQWQGFQQLDEWVLNAPKVWLSRQREHALGSVRQSLLSQMGVTQQVEVDVDRSIDHTQPEVSDDGKRIDNWDTEWDHHSQTAVDVSLKDNRDDDGSAWITDERDDSDEPTTTADTADSNDTDMAWGWDDDGSGPAKAETKVQENFAKPAARSPRKSTVGEKCTVTGIPEALFDLCIKIFAQAKTLRDSAAAESTIGAGIPALSNLPVLAMALYRAMAVTAYDKIAHGKLFLYNDSRYMVPCIRGLTSGTHRKSDDVDLTASVLKKLEQEALAFDRFAKLALSAEIDSQQTILRDLLDGAQGFSNCTSSPFAEECDNAVSMTVDRLRDVHQQWQPILSKSALLSSVGSLLSTVVSKFIMDIEDLSDIGEDESKRLLSYCKSISSISSLFVEEVPGTETTREITPMHCHNWLKLQYLGEILEGNLADIKYLWKDGELSMEFDADEVSDLIRALFADSEHRRRAISEINRR